jgi:hypothetical protein
VFIKVAASFFETCFALRLIRMVPNARNLQQGFDQDYNKHDSPYILSVEAGRDAQGQFSAFRWRPQLESLDSQMSFGWYRSNLGAQNGRLGDELFPVIKRTALSGGIKALWNHVGE